MVKRVREAEGFNKVAQNESACPRWSVREVQTERCRYLEFYSLALDIIN